MSSILITESIGVRKTKGPVRPTGNLTHVYLHGTSKTSTCTAQKSHEAKRCTTQDTINLGVLTQHGCWDFSTLCTNTYSMPGQINLPNLSTLPEILYPILIPKYNKKFSQENLCEEKKIDFFPFFLAQTSTVLIQDKIVKNFRTSIVPQF